MSELVTTASSGLPLDGSALQRLKGLTAQPAVKRALPWFLGASAIGGAALAWALIAPAPQRTLYTELDDGERASVAASLDKAGIAYSIDNDTGALSVAESELYRARMLVASDGGLASPDAAASLDSLPLGASRTLEGERLRAVREHELMLTIQEIDGVEAVRVHLAEASKSVFVREDTPPTASVMMRMARGRQLASSQVAAIVNLVSASVPGMSADAVRVIDQHGRLLSQADSAENNRIELQARLEDKLRTQLDQLLTPMLGAGNFSSEIQVDLDMDQVTSARESYDKDGVVRSETQSQSQSAAGGGGANAGGIPGALSNTPPPAVTASPGPPQGTQAPAAAPAPNPIVPTGESSATRTYELGREVAVANSTPGKVRRLSVAVAIAQEAMKKGKPADVDQIKALVAAATGVDAQRGDQVTVMVRPFQPVSEEGIPFYETSWFALALRAVGALVALLLVLLMGVRPLIRALKREPAEISPNAETGGSVAHHPAPIGVAPADAATLGRQVNLAQRIMEEKPDDALLALRQMLGHANAEAAQ